MKTPRFGHQVAQVVFDEHHRGVEFLMHRLFALVRQLQVITETSQCSVILLGSGRRCVVRNTKQKLLFDGELLGDFGPEAGVFHRSDGLLRVAIHVHVKQQPAKRRP